jgi:hypothetical protein
MECFDKPGALYPEPPSSEVGEPFRVRLTLDQCLEDGASGDSKDVRDHPR